MPWSKSMFLRERKKWRKEENAPKKKIVQLVEEGLKELNYNKKIDKIRLCRGDCFDLVRVFFKKEEIKYESASIEGILQDAVETHLVSHLRKLGVRSKNLTKKSGIRRYFVLFNWISRDFPKREKYVKKGFKKWRTVWREKAIENYNKYMQNKKNQIR